MVSVSEACSIVLKHLFKPTVRTVTLEQAINQVLAEKISADRDLPPANRVTMDGIAINFSAWENGSRKFIVEATQAAGDPPRSLSLQVNCIEVMTGTILPANTDTVIPYEELSIADGAATITCSMIVKGQNLHLQGSDAKAGELQLSQGMRMSSAEVALLASIGKSTVEVFGYPKTAIISSGDELVAIDVSPEAYQVRRSNGYAIQAAMSEYQWEGAMFHLPDNKEEMKTALNEIFKSFDILILSGGVSKGKFDYVPSVLEEIGMSKHFHRVNQRPGKPFWFGTSSDNKTVFALPGNPVSTYMCFYKYILPWMKMSMQGNVEQPKALLAAEYEPPKNMTYFLQVRAINERGVLMAYPETGGGSGDFANLKGVTGFIEMPPTAKSYKQGDVFDYIPFRREP